MKKLIALLATSLLAACSGEIDDQGNLVDIEQNQQAYSARVTTNYQFGTRTTASRRQCDRSTTGQTCSVPKTKNLTYCINQGFTNSEVSLIQNEVVALDNLLTSWTFTYESDLFTGLCVPGNNLQFSNGACGSSGTASSNIENYGCVTFSNITNLTEGVAAGDPVGNYQAHGGSRANIDITDINAKFSTTSQRDFGKKHAVKFALLSTIGLGSRTDGGSNTFGSRPQIANFALGIMTDGEKCRAESYNTTNNGDFSLPNVGWVCATGD